MVIDPQDHEIGGTGLPKQCLTEDLIGSWEKGNQFAVEALRRQGEKLLYMSRQQAEAWWKYTSQRCAVQEKFGDRAFVPKIMLARRKGESTVRRVIVWMQGSPQVIPECDFFLVATGEGFTVSPGERSLMVGYSSVLEQIGSSLDECPDLPGCQIGRAHV